MEVKPYKIDVEHDTLTVGDQVVHVEDKDDQANYNLLATIAVCLARFQVHDPAQFKKLFTGVGKERPLKFSLEASDVINDGRIYNPQSAHAYYSPQENTIHLPYDTLLMGGALDTVDHELNHAIDDFKNPDTLRFASESTSSLAYGAYHFHCDREPNLALYRDLHHREIYAGEVPLTEEEKEKLKVLKQDIPYACFTEQEYVAENHYYTTGGDDNYLNILDSILNDFLLSKSIATDLINGLFTPEKLMPALEQWMEGCNLEEDAAVLTRLMDVCNLDYNDVPSKYSLETIKTDPLKPIHLFLLLQFLDYDDVEAKTQLLVQIFPQLPPVWQEKAAEKILDNTSRVRGIFSEEVILALARVEAPAVDNRWKNLNPLSFKPALTSSNPQVRDVLKKWVKASAQNNQDESGYNNFYTVVGNFCTMVSESFLKGEADATWVLFLEELMADPQIAQGAKNYVESALLEIIRSTTDASLAKHLKSVLDIDTSASQEEEVEGQSTKHEGMFYVGGSYDTKLDRPLLDLKMAYRLYSSGPKLNHKVEGMLSTGVDLSFHQYNPAKDDKSPLDLGFDIKGGYYSHAFHDAGGFYLLNGPSISIDIADAARFMVMDEITFGTNYKALSVECSAGFNFMDPTQWQTGCGVALRVR
ncbi:hypothetical protein K1X76_06590 [bacterium]|nr:hypothetical protein [bacterium]